MCFAYGYLVFILELLDAIRVELTAEDFAAACTGVRASSEHEQLLSVFRIGDRAFPAALRTHTHHHYGSPLTLGDVKQEEVVQSHLWLKPILELRDIPIECLVILASIYEHVLVLLDQ